MAARNPKWIMNAGAGLVSAEEARLGDASEWLPGASAVKVQSGVVPSQFTPLRVHQTVSASAQLFIEAGHAVIQGTESATQGAYTATLDSQFTYNYLATFPADTQPRNDIIVARIQDKAYSGTLATFTVEAIKGTASGSPVDPTLPNNCLALARVRLPANATTVADAVIDDLRVYTATVGGVTPCTSSTRPSFPFIGQHIYETDTTYTRVWNGTTWTALTSPITVPTGNRNLLRNGDFSVAQRGTGPFTAAGYTLDGWCQALGGGTFSLSRSTLTLGSQQAKYGFAWTRTVAGGSNGSLYQRIEDVTRTSGQTVTFSFSAVSTVTVTLAVYLQQHFGSGGAPSAAVLTGTQNAVVTTTPTRFTLTYTLASVAGKTLGTNGDDSLSAFWDWLVASANGTVTIWDAQVELGTVATPFERRHQQIELVDSLRSYYRRTGGIMGPGVAITASTGKAQIWFPVPMRAVPSSTAEYDGTPGNLSFNNAVTNSPLLGAPTYSNLTVNGAQVNGANGGGMVAGTYWELITIVGTAFLGFSAEIPA